MWIPRWVQKQAQQAQYVIRKGYEATQIFALPAVRANLSLILDQNEDDWDSVGSLPRRSTVGPSGAAAGDHDHRHPGWQAPAEEPRLC